MGENEGFDFWAPSHSSITGEGVKHCTNAAHCAWPSPQGMIASESLRLLLMTANACPAPTVPASITAPALRLSCSTTPVLPHSACSHRYASMHLLAAPPATIRFAASFSHRAALLGSTSYWCFLSFPTAFTLSTLSPSLSSPTPPAAAATAVPLTLMLMSLTFDAPDRCRTANMPPFAAAPPLPALPTSSLSL